MPSVQRSPRPPQSVPFSGLREQNKIDKLRRIREAARELFIEKGYDDATTREIALRAGVGIGTVFTYAENKRDLLFLIANDDLDEVSRKAELALREDASCLDNLLSFFRHHYRFFAKQPELSRLLLREMTFYDAGRQASRFQETRERNIRAVGRIVEIAVERGALRVTDEPDLAGWVAFCVFQVELRRWLLGKTLNLADGMARLERALRLCMAGWGAKPETLTRR
ncbi:TetR/AcrR family transcriptional regulator [Rhodoplanes sp. Z2-YC6860]|uniref:TetR/AcrR family transcriptional regulator n=1 Tax=Rhodoplanes sp. Z2-YC6860 TaxID=674703 RepID=UPI00078C0AD7|nr:TetR/AcrR family transcriptional regulator [Rhodoplanes sp. Z2-YC6860]AMN45222.1 TetR family transcriptional regulator [Rhodoplanes sp. Z2-YC6860]